MTAAATRPRRRLKVRGGSLGWLLCWGVVFADIGTSVYYSPGILYQGGFTTRSALFVGMTLVVFVLLSLKYAEVAWRYPEGGGVVNVASRALHPFVGLLGGCFILVDYFLTAALSALSGMFYLAVVAPSLYPRVVPATVGALVLLGLLNALGIKESARASMLFATLAAGGQVLVVLAVAVSLGPVGVVHSFAAIGHGPRLTALTLVTGYAAAFLAFSGLETIAQLAPAMREPRAKVARRAMAAVVVSMVITSPLLTLWSTTLLNDAKADPNQYISLLGAHVAGPALGGYVAVSGALLLIFASNTALIGCYHVFIALSRTGFLPRLLESRNRWRNTPQWSILVAVAVPVALVVATRGSTGILGDLYAFGLLGAFILTCVSLDVVRWFDPRTWRTSGGRAMFWVGVLTTVLVSVAWLVNLRAKPLATIFGGAITVLGVLLGLATYYYSRSRQPVVFPWLHRADLPVVQLGAGRRLPPAEVLAILPHEPEAAEAVVTAAVRAATPDRVLVFVYRGDPAFSGPGELMEVSDPYLRDREAQVAFARAERRARRTVPDRRYVYVPGKLRREAMGDVWRSLYPKETVVLDGDQDLLPPIACDRVRRDRVDGYPILNLVASRLRPAVAS
ncbi:MAG: APC family permease [Candidatus Dormibacteraeota bacterium]|nr:APC family permease [Candidatus Dormibacteraeota bacterium]